MLLTILVLLLAVSLLGGGWGHSRYGYVGWSPAGIVLLVLFGFWITGNLNAY